MRIAFWLTAAGLFALASLASVAIAMMQLRGKNLPVVAPKLTLSDVVNMATLVVALVSIVIAVATYIDVKASGEKQQVSLDASRRSLEAAVRIAEDQHAELKESSGLLRQNVEATQTQLRVVQADQQRTLAELAKKPNILMSGIYVPLEQSNVPGELWIIAKPTKGKIAGAVRLQNTGNGVLTKAFLHVTVRESSIPAIVLGCSNFLFKGTPDPPPIRGTLDSIKISLGDLLPGAPPTEVEITIEFDPSLSPTADFKLDFAIYGDQVPTEVSLGTVTFR
jgi:hypothetical protein